MVARGRGFVKNMTDRYDGCRRHLSSVLFNFTSPSESISFFLHYSWLLQTARQTTTRSILSHSHRQNVFRWDDVLLESRVAYPVIPFACHFLLDRRNRLCSNSRPSRKSARPAQRSNQPGRVEVLFRSLDLGGRSHPVLLLET